jgi:RNA polymerase subunit RPABC4/transcription elongation factor Spt4
MKRYILNTECLKCKWLWPGDASMCPNCKTDEWLINDWDVA